MSEETLETDISETPPADGKSLQYIEAEDLRKKKQLPKFPAYQLTLEDLQAWLNLLTMDQLPRVLIYLYRTMPIIVRQQVDPNADTNIDKVTGLDENDLKHWKLQDIRNNWIKPIHGGGGYRLDICDTANPNKKGKGSKLGECRFVIPDSEAEPIINLHELDMGKKENKAYINKLVAQGKLDKDCNVIETKANNDGAIVTAMKEAFAMAEKLNASQQAVFRKELGISDSSGKATTDVMLEMIKQNDPKKQMDQILTMVTALTTAMKSNAPVAAPQDNTAVLIKLMMDQNQQNMVLFTKMMDMQIESIKATANTKAQVNPGGVDPMDVVERMFSFADRINAYKNGQSEQLADDEPKTWQDKAFDIVEKVGTPLAMAWLQKQYSNAGPAMPQPGMPTAQFSPPQSALPKPQPNGVNTGAGRPYSPYGPGAPTAPQQTTPVQQEVPINPEVLPPNGTPQPQQEGVEVIQAIAAYGPMIAEKMVAGVKGYDFGEWVKNGFGITPIMIVKKYPAAQIVAMVKQHIPQFYQAVQHLGDEYITNWIDEFGRTEEILDRLDKEDDMEDSPL